LTNTEIAVRSTELVEQSAGALALHGGQTQWTPDQHAALKQLGLAEATEADLKVLMHQSQRTGLDPFSRQIYMIGRWDPQTSSKKYTIQTGIDGFRLIAERRPEYLGQVGPEWCGKDGVWRDVWLEDGPPVAARVGVLRSDRPQPAYGVAKFSEFAQYKSAGGLTAMWSSKSSHMIAKCAEALALRKAFPHDLAGLHTDDEMARHEVVEAPSRAPSLAGGGITVDELTGGTTKATAATAAGPAPGEFGYGADAEPPTGGGKPATRDQLNKLHAQLGDLDVKERADKLTTVSLLAGRTLATSNDLTIAEASRVIDLLDQVLASGTPADALDMALANAENAAGVEPAQAAPAAMVAKLKEQRRACEVTKPAEQLKILGQLAGRQLTQWSDLTADDGQKAVEVLVRAGHADDPVNALDHALTELESGSGGGS
jgi:phage recombination protein Bet